MAASAWVYPLYRSMWTALDWVFPPVCAGCGKFGYRWCQECQQHVPVLRGKVCISCGMPLDDGGLCHACEQHRPPFQALRSWAAFDDPLRQALHRLKYRRDIGLGDALAVQMVDFILKLDWPIDMIVPIPLGKTRQKERGYNQVGMVARPLSLALGLAYSPKALIRRRDTRSQVGLPREQRRENVRDAFQAVGVQVRDRTILLMDDVATTGSTLEAGADALLSAGARQVYALTVARALPRHDLQLT